MADYKDYLIQKETITGKEFMSLLHEVQEERKKWELAAMEQHAAALAEATAAEKPQEETEAPAAETPEAEAPAEEKPEA